MSDSASSSDSSRLARVIADFIEATERGEKPDRDALLAAHAEQAVELRKFFADYDHLGVTNLQAITNLFARRITRLSADKEHSSMVRDVVDNSRRNADSAASAAANFPLHSVSLTRFASIALPSYL